MEEFVNMNMELLNTLKSTSNGPMTAFLISDAAISNLQKDTVLYLQANTDKLLQVMSNIILHNACKYVDFVIRITI